jgi:hypothetical protein
MWVVCRIIIGIPAARTGRFNSTTPQAQEWRLSNVLRDIGQTRDESQRDAAQYRRAGLGHLSVGLIIIGLFLGHVRKGTPTRPSDSGEKERSFIGKFQS